MRLTMNKQLTNLLDQPVRVGDIVALYTTSHKSTSMRIAKIVRIEEVDYKRYDYQSKSYVFDKKMRTFVRLTNTKRVYDSSTGQWSSPILYSYVKEVFGVGESVPVNFCDLSREMQEVFK